MKFYDRASREISMSDFNGLLLDMEYKRIAEDDIGELWVSTVWLGVNYQFRDGPPLIFETMVFRGKDMDADPDKALDLNPEVRDWIGQQWRWSTEAEALTGHYGICLEIRQDLAKVSEAEQVKEEMRCWNGEV